MNNHTIYSSIPNITMLHGQIESLLETTSASVYWKDKKGRYLGTNDQFVQVANVKSCDEIIGKTDKDLLWFEHAPTMMLNDQEIITTGHTKTFLEASKSLKNEPIHYLSYKTPLCSPHGKILGILGLSFKVHDGNTLVNALGETLSQIDKQIYGKKRHDHPFKMSSDLLSKQQMNCLYYLVRGMTLKQIAIQLNLSPKTVENYLNTVKIKLNCNTRTELIEKALQIEAIKNQL